MQNSVFKIFLADDDEDDRLLFKEAISTLAIEIDLKVFDCGESLCDALLNRESNPSLIFLDINMPVMSGIECLIELRERTHLDEIPIVVLSTSFYPAQVEKINKLGASHYFQKPSTFPELKTSILDCFDRFLELD